MPLRKKITVSAVSALPPETTLWDTELKGFCIRRQKSAAVTYMLKLRVGGQIRWATIGRHGAVSPQGAVWSPDTARRQAIQILANPKLAERPAASVAPPPPSTLFADIADQFLVVHGPKLKPRTLEEYRRILRLYLKPAFGPKPVRDITRADVSTAHAGWSRTPRGANHALAVLSKFCSWCEDQGYRDEDSNPCRRVQHYKETRRETYLQPEEFARLGAALDQAEADKLTSPYVVAALRLLLLTGARLSEILTLRWVHVDLGRRMIFLPDSKTGQKPLTLNGAAVALLESLPKVKDNPFVIVGHIHGSHLVNLQKPWRTIRAAAGLEHVRLHDLRHTFASVAVASGGSLPVLAKQLGHSQAATTQRYAHLADDATRQLTQTTGQKITEALSRRDLAKPEPEPTMADFYGKSIGSD